MHSAHTFLEDIAEKSSAYPDSSMIFMDEVTFDFSFLKKYKARNKKKATFVLALTKDGIILKPFVIFCPNIEPEKEAANENCIVTYQTETGDADENSLIKWVHDCLLAYTHNSPSLLIVDSWAKH